MKKIIFILFCCLVTDKAVWGQTDNTILNDTVFLPIEFRQGFGPFYGGFIAIQWFENESDSVQQKMQPRVTGVPKQLNQIKVGLIIYHPKQWLYQNYTSKKISFREYSAVLQKSRWSFDTSKLFPGYLKCFTPVLMAEDEKGQVVAMIDRNNNLDFSDDAVFYPQTLDERKTDEQAQQSTLVFSERIVDNEVVEDSIPLLIVKKQSAKDSLFHLFYTIPQYARAILADGNKKYVINIFCTYPVAKTYSFPQLALNSSSPGKLNPDSLTNPGEQITIGNKVFTNAGVDLTHNVLLLKRQIQQEKLFSTKMGYYAPQFAGKDFLTGDSIKLSDYKGKYVFVDFWGTWCAPCRAEIPNIKTAYEHLSGKIKFLGIVGQDTPDSLASYLSQKEILWSQILSDQIPDDYRISGYPSNFLIDPAGKIIAKDLRGSDLINQLNELVP